MPLLSRRTFFAGSAGLALTPALAVAESIESLIPKYGADPGDWLADALEKCKAKYGIPGMAAAVMLNGQVVLEKVVGIRKAGTAEQLVPTDAMQMGSISKPFTGALAGVMIDKGLVKWGTTILDVFPDIASEMRPEYRKVDFLLLLSHLSGMPYMPSKEPGDLLSKDFPDPVKGRAEYVRLAVMDPPTAPLGTKTIYGGGSIIAAAMIERIAGKPFEALIKEHIFGPLKMTTATLARVGETPPGLVWQHRYRDGVAEPFAGVGWAPGTVGYVHGPAGGVCCSAADLLRFARAFFEGNPILSSETRRVLTTPVKRMQFCPGWGSQFHKPGDVEVEHSGSNGSNWATFMVSPTRRSAFAVCANAQPENNFLVDINERLRSNMLSNSLNSAHLFDEMDLTQLEGGITVEFWQCVDSARPQFAFVVDPDDSRNRLSAHTPYEDGRVYFDFGDTEKGGRCVFTPSDSILNRWIHFAMVADVSNNAMGIYMNGKLEYVRQGVSHIRPAKYRMKVGASSLPCTGPIAGFRVWNFPRSRQNIQRDFGKRLAGDTKGIIGSWVGAWSEMVASPKH